jgi:ACS family glucarate transporter-like MFS transporter
MNSASAITRTDPAAEQARTRVRYGIVAMLFVASTINYADRATLSIAGTPIATELGLDPVAMGYVFSAFGWAYVIGQLPGGWLLDRFGSKLVYGLSLLTWSLFTFLQGFISQVGLGPTAIVAVLFILRFMVGLAEAPSFPANGRIVAAWFPNAERGTASAIFNSSQYFALVIFSPIMGSLVHHWGWPYVFWVMGGLGIAMGFMWFKVIYSPSTHPRVSASELEYIRSGGGLVALDQRNSATIAPAGGPKWSHLGELLRNRMMLGVYLGQYCITTLTYFFLTWFPVYLVKERQMSVLKAGFVASLPALCGFAGGILGGVYSDYLLKSGRSLTVARKVPIVAGMLLSSSMVLCNYTDSELLVVVVMAVAFFGKGFGALGWAVVSDTSPKEIAGLSGGLFNTFGNVAAITTPIVIGYIVKGTGSYTGALVFVGANALVAIFCYLVLVGEIRRVELTRS